MMENAMSAEILPFPKPRMPTGLPDPHEHQERIQEHRRQVILDVRSAAEHPASKFERDDEIAPARAINKLIAEAKDQRSRSVIFARLLQKGISTFGILSGYVLIT
jgi:hypothetical protein